MKKVAHEDRVKTLVKLLTVAEFIDDNGDAEWERTVDDIKEIIEYFEKLQHPMLGIIRIRKGTSLMYCGSPIWLEEDAEFKHYGPIYFKGKSSGMDKNKESVLSVLPQGSTLQLNGTDMWSIYSTNVSHYKDLSTGIG